MARRRTRPCGSRRQASAADLKQEARIEIDFDAEAKDGRALAALFPEIPDPEDLGPGRAHGRIVSRNPGLGLDDLDLRTREPREGLGGGRRRDQGRPRPSRRRPRGPLRRSEPPPSAVAPRSPPAPDIGLRRRRRNSGQGRHPSGSRTRRLHGGEDSPVEIHVDLRFDELPGREKLEAHVTLVGEDLRTLGEIAGLDLPPVSPVELSGILRGSAEQPEVEKLALRIGESRFSAADRGLSRVGCVHGSRRA